MRHLELFAGIGGFRQAMSHLENDGGPRFRCVGYSEFDEAAARTYNANFDTTGEVVLGDIEQFVADEARIDALPDFDLLTGGFPCQSFSMMGEQLGFNDARGTLFFRMLQIINVVRPRYLLMENVKNLRTHDHGHTFEVIVGSLEQLGYTVSADVFNTADYGLAQTRNRVYIFATLRRVPRGFVFSNANVLAHFNQLGNTSLCHQNSTIDVLAQIVDQKYFLSNQIKGTILSNGTGGYVANSEIDLPVARPLCATMAKMHRACQDNYYSETYINSHGQNRFNRDEDDYHQTQIRRLTPTEAFALQGFNDEFAANAIGTGLADGRLYKQAGNAVSVNVVYAILSYLSQTFNWR